MGTVKLSQLKAGDTIELDNAFSCVEAGEVTVRVDKNGDLYFACPHGEHFLDGQLAYDGDTLIGVVGHTPKAGGSNG